MFGDGFLSGLKEMSSSEQSAATTNAPSHMDGSGWTVGTGGASVRGQGPAGADALPWIVAGVAGLALVLNITRRG